MMRVACLLLTLGLLPGCAGAGLTALSQAGEIAQIRIARQTLYNDTRLRDYLEIAAELKRKIIDEIDEGDIDMARALLPEYHAIMEQAKPLLLIEEAKRLADAQE